MALPGSLLAWPTIWLLGLCPVYATDYYVAPTGSDSGPGTLVQPFQTIQKAASVMVAGDTAFIRAGTYRETVTPVKSGMMTAPNKRSGMHIYLDHQRDGNRDRLQSLSR
jgi:hypothetical protein